MPRTTAQTIDFSLPRGAVIAALAVVGMTYGAARAQLPEVVAWTPPTVSDVKPGAKVDVTLRGAVKEGWHLYSLKQLPKGPTSLYITLDPSTVAKVNGTPTGSPPVKIHDRAFDLETQYYDRDFTLTVPVRIAAKAPAGKQVIPVAVRFQTCSGDICQPPKTVRLSVPVNVKAG